MQTIEQLYGDKAKAIRDAVTVGSLRISKAVVSIAAEKARTEADVKIEYERVDVLAPEGSLVLYGSQDKANQDLSYAWDLGVRSKVRAAFLVTVTDPDKELRKMAALGVKAGLFTTEEEGLADLKARKAAKDA